MAGSPLTVGVIVQARMGSTRLPGKVLMPIAGRPLLGHVLARLARATHPVTVVVATSDLPQDGAIERFCAERGVACFRGSERDVLARYHACAAAHGFGHVVRMTADNPFPDVEELDRLIAFHLGSGNDFSHSFTALPVGVGAEIFTMQALEAAHAEGHASHHREHVDEFLLEHPERFRTRALEVPAAKRRPDVRLTVDTEADYRMACGLAEQLGRPDPTTLEAIAYCSSSA